ncbi:MAG TPA: bifunctional phosphopantothenoylcysteine decarboxylase/phosphopantothenate--cysteine ligase CoaBC [Anaerolineae bacterium]|nr:bifunctional phosphopantothenoylcysteine decarboxylase/phosphopantothenate--cysteine ligase CoaBC [Anaerolineae bacterium]
MPLLENKRILLGITGSIAAYKSAELASRLTQSGALVDVILSQAACEFVSALTFQSITGRRAYTDEDLWGHEAHILHVGLADGAALYAIAPISANTIAKLSHGIADTLLTVTALAIRCPLLIAPAMDAGMFEHEATQANLALLRERQVTVVGPAPGRLASGQMGIGRMSEPKEIFGHMRLLLGQSGPLAGRKVVVTAGGTQEPIDPVRAITNHSSGKQGFALAQAALDRGAEVTLICGPTALDTPTGVSRLDVCTAEEMEKAVLESIPETDVLLMAAAVADFRPVQISSQKVKRGKGVPELKLEPTVDILAQVTKQRNKKGWPRIVVGFAAESENLVEHARSKLNKKDLSLVVANDITASDSGFGVDTNRVTLLDQGGGVEKLPLSSKTHVAGVVLDRVVSMLRGDQK